VDLPAFEDALVALCADGARRAAMSARAEARARAVYDWRVVVRGYEQVWTTLSARSPSARAPLTLLHHPAALDFGQVFAHYPTGAIQPELAVRRTDLSRVLCAQQNGYFIYPELRHVFEGDDVMAALAHAEAETTVGQIARAIAGRWMAGESWRADFLLTWLLKHGLLELTGRQ
jgi:hypothetical protein